MLFELITSGRCDAVYQTPRMWATWQIEGRTSDDVAVSFRLVNKFVQRFVSAGLLIETDSEKVLTPSTDVEWIPVGEKKVAA